MRNVPLLAAIAVALGLFPLRCRPDLIDVDQPPADGLGSGISLLDHDIDLIAGPVIVALQALLLAVVTKLRIIERRPHGRAKRDEPVSGYARRSHDQPGAARAARHHRGGGTAFPLRVRRVPSGVTPRSL